MTEQFRKLNKKGYDVFSRFIIDGAKKEKDIAFKDFTLGEVPREILRDPKTSETTKYNFQISSRKFHNKYDFGQYLCELLSDIPDDEIENDYLFWNTLSLEFFDNICFKTREGVRKVQAKEKWLIGEGIGNYYRHLVRSPWLFIKLYNETAKFLLQTRYKHEHLVSMVPETLEQFGSRGILLRNEKVVNLFSKLYFDHVAQEPKPGLSGNEAGSPRRMGKVLRQLALTFDLERMSESDLEGILPKEFEGWINQK